MPDMVTKLVKEILAANQSPQTVAQLVDEIHEKGYPRITKKQVIEYLDFAKPNGVVTQVQVPGRDAQGWILTPKRTRPPDSPEATAPRFSDRLYRWQSAALTQWNAHHQRGIVEAVTASGKTMVALAGWEQLREKVKPLNTLIVVPTVDLMHQWHDRFSQAFPDHRIGLIGGGHKDDFSKAPICISVINSAVRHLDELFAHVQRSSVKTFLIADECHRYIEPAVFQRIRHFGFTYTLGLSATIDPFQVRGLGQVIYTYGFADAVRDGLIPKFDLVNTRVSLTDGEQANHEALTEKIADQIDLVKRLFTEELRGVPSGDAFWKKLQSLMQLPNGGKEPTIARLFGLIFRRAAISYTATMKMELAKKLVVTLLNQGRKKVIVFFERIRSAEEVQSDVGAGSPLDVEAAQSLQAAVLEEGTNWCQVLHSGLAREERRTRLEEFRSNTVAALLACRVLDEGLDVPEIDAAILVASSQSKRQRIQRVGRSLRKGDGKKRPLVITLYVPETSDVNVTAEDNELFGEAAKIYKETAETCLVRVHHLLNANRHAL